MCACVRARASKRKLNTKRSHEARKNNSGDILIFTNSTPLHLIVQKKIEKQIKRLEIRVEEFEGEIENDLEKAEKEVAKDLKKFF